MSKADKTKKLDPAPQSQSQAQPAFVGLTGVAFSLEASKDQNFNNFRILTIFLIDGQVVHVERSQEFAAFEALSRTEILVNSSLWNLSSRYAHGAIQSLGGTQRDELVERWRKTNPELLTRLAPALGIKSEGTTQ